MPRSVKSPLPRPWSFVEEELDWGRSEPTNIAWYCTDRVCRQGAGGRTALIWEDAQGNGRAFSFDDLRRRSDGVAQFLRNIGLGPGERIALWMERRPEYYVALLGILKLGAIVLPASAELPEESTALRFADSGAAAVITQRRLLPRTRRLGHGLRALERVVVVDAPPGALAGSEVAMPLDALPDVPGFEIAHTLPGSPALLHYTSGTTAQSRGAVHVHAALLAQHWTTRTVLGVRQGDVVWCTAEAGTMAMTAYGVIGPWANGLTVVACGGGFDPDRWYRMIEHHRVSVWHTSPDAIAALARHGTARARHFDLGSLRELVSGGARLDPESFAWSEATFGRPFRDAYGQTETGAIVIANLPGAAARAGSMGKPVPGVSAAVIELRSSRPVTAPGQEGLIALKPDFPSMVRAFWNNKRAFDGRFRGAWFLTGDRARMDADGCYWFAGRADGPLDPGPVAEDELELE